MNIASLILGITISVIIILVSGIFSIYFWEVMEDEMEGKKRGKNKSNRNKRS